MEINLNHAVSEVEKNVACNGDCEQGDYVCSLSSSTNRSNSSSAQVSSYLELWHACAGPLTSLPKKGNVVVYFPQGHLEQVVSFYPLSPREMSTYDLQPQIFCKVVNVDLLANNENDEVYTQVSLVPQPELQGTDLKGNELGKLGLDDEDGGSRTKSSSTPHMFCKTLTASDTSTHGGFSVPRRAAEDCFPPLDYKLQRPSQELVAKDLHGTEWRFRHIYRGQPRRHLLTTGWSIFVSQKNLVSGDAVLFLRGESGELRLGIRRSIRPRNCLPESVVRNQSSYPSILSSVASAIANSSVFHVYYAPRASQAEFVVPYQKYIKSISNTVTMGVRFKMRFENEESSEGRCSSGIVRGISDLDHFKWPNSKWRCLMVRWDDDTAISHQERVSPWEIDCSGSLPPSSIQSSPRMKKLCTGFRPTTPRNLTTAGGEFMDFEESVRSSKVLQGQENIDVLSPYYGVDAINQQSKFETPPTRQNVASTGMWKVPIEKFSRIHPSKYTGFAEVDRIPRVLQGQQILPWRFLSDPYHFYRGAWSKRNLGGATLNMHQAPQPAFQPTSSEILQSMFISYGDIRKVSNRSVCSITDFQRETDSSNLTTDPVEITRAEVALSDDPDEQEVQEEGSANPALGLNLRIPNKENFNAKMNGCRLFGISLIENMSNLQNPTRRSCTKVHKQGSLVGRAIDLSRIHRYGDLFMELERLFGMEGLLQSPDAGWRILYTDSENDIMVVGDEPWHEFRKVVSKIHIYTQEEVEKMTIGIINDTQSCLEQSPVNMEASKSSSVGQPDSSPTAVRV